MTTIISTPSFAGLVLDLRASSEKANPSCACYRIQPPSRLRNARARLKHLPQEECHPTLPGDGVGPAYPALPLLVNITFFFDKRRRANESTDPWTSTFASHPVSCSRGHSTMAINAWSAGLGAAARVRHPVTEEGGKFRVTPWRRRRRACWKRSCSDHVRGGLK